MCCCFLPRCTVIFAGIFCLLQSIAWAILSFLGIALYSCDLEVTYERANPVYYLYFVYFFNKKCAYIPDDLNFEKVISDTFTTPAGFTTPYPITTPFPLPAWPDTFGPVEYTHDLMVAYAVLSVLWAVTSFIIVVAGALRIRTWVAYVPWILVAVGNIILDVVATINFAGQATDSQSLLGLLELIGVENIPEGDEVSKLLGGLDGLTMVPSLVMALLSSRVLVFWLLNVLLVICVAVATQRLSKDKKHENSRLPPYPYHKENLTLPVDNDKNPVEAGGGIPANAATGLRIQSEYDYANNNNNNNNRPFSYTPDDPKMISRAFLHPPQASVRDSLASSTAIPRVGSSLRSPSPEPLYLECLEPTPSEKKTNYENVRDPDARTRAAVIPRISSDRSQQRSHPSAADLRRRPTSYEEARPLDRKFLQTNDDRVQDPNRGSGLQPPDELRGQLPWSYFGPRNAPMKPPPLMEEELERPPVPVPDYTLHFGKASRPSTSNWSDDDSAPVPGVGRTSSLLERNRY